MKTEHQRGIGTPRFPRIVDNHQTGQQRKPFFTGERIHPHMPGFHHKDRGCIHPHLFEQFFGSRILQHLYTILTEHFSPEQTDRFIGISRNHRRNHTVQSLEIHRPTHPVEKVGLLSPGCIMGTLADHLLQSIHQIIPMRFVQVTGYPDHIPVFPQIAYLPAQLYLGDKLDMATAHRRSSYRKIMSVFNIFQENSGIRTYCFGIQELIDLLHKLSPPSTQFESFGRMMRTKHQSNIRISRNIFPELQQITVDLRLLDSRVIGFFKTKLHKTGQIVINMTRQKNLCPFP